MRMLPIIKVLMTLVICLFFSSELLGQDTTKIKEGIVKVETSQQIKQLIAKKRQYNKTKRHVKGYKIQLFYGSEQGAIDVKTKFENVFTDMPAKLGFDSPYWKVIVGNYKTRLEVDRALVEIKDAFPSAIPIPAKVKI